MNLTDYLLIGLLGLFVFVGANYLESIGAFENNNLLTDDTFNNYTESKTHTFEKRDKIPIIEASHKLET